MPPKRAVAIAAVLLSILVLAPSTAHAQDASKKPTPDAWSAFKFPEVVVVDRDKGETKGSALVHRLIPDLDAFIQEIALGVCKRLYKNADEVPTFDQVTFELEHYNGVAAKSGQPPKIRIKLSTRYLEGQYARMGDEAITYEIAGVNWHELTHGYQHVPRHAGGYRPGTDHFGFIEGTADAVRILAGYHKTRRPRPGGHWNDGYTTTGFFIAWLVENRDPDFLYKLNQSCKTLDPWTWDKACKSILGEEVTIAALWDEYEWHLKGGGKEAVARFSPETDLICKGRSVRFNNTSFNKPVSYQWTFEGGTPATSTEAAPVVSYAKPGEYTVSLVAKNEHGTTTKRVESCIRVLDREGSLINLTKLGGEITHDSGTPAMPREGVRNLLDQDPRSKFCVLVPRTRIQYALPEPYELCSYSFTSANDAPGRDPEKWTLEASDDGNDWTVIDRREGQTFRNRHETRRFTIEAKKPYKFYRWNLEAKSDRTFQIADIGMVGVKAE